jgi:hypothetical protein
MRGGGPGNVPRPTASSQAGGNIEHRVKNDEVSCVGGAFVRLKGFEPLTLSSVG